MTTMGTIWEFFESGLKKNILAGHGRRLLIVFRIKSYLKNNYTFVPRKQVLYQISYIITILQDFSEELGYTCFEDESVFFFETEFMKFQITIH